MNLPSLSASDAQLLKSLVAKSIMAGYKLSLTHTGLQDSAPSVKKKNKVICDPLRCKKVYIMYSLLTGAHRGALPTHCTNGKCPVGILQSAAATGVAFIVDFFKSQMKF